MVLWNGKKISLMLQITITWPNLASFTLIDPISLDSIDERSGCLERWADPFVQQEDKLVLNDDNS